MMNSTKNWKHEWCKTKNICSQFADVFVHVSPSRIRGKVLDVTESYFYISLTCMAMPHGSRITPCVGQASTSQDYLTSHNKQHSTFTHTQSARRNLNLGTLSLLSRCSLISTLYQGTALTIINSMAHCLEGLRMWKKMATHVKMTQEAPLWSREGTNMYKLEFYPGIMLLRSRWSGPPGFVNTVTSPIFM